jgi:hypothetical protein
MRIYRKEHKIQQVRENEMMSRGNGVNWTDTLQLSTPVRAELNKEMWDWPKRFLFANCNP